MAASLLDHWKIEKLVLPLQASQTQSLFQFVKFVQNYFSAQKRKNCERLYRIVLVTLHAFSRLALNGLSVFLTPGKN